MFKSWTIMSKGERLPKHGYKDYDYTDGYYHYYSLYEDNTLVKLIARYAEPRKKGAPRLIRMNEEA